MNKYIFVIIFLLASFAFVATAGAIGLGDAATKFDEVAGQKGAGAQVAGTDPEDIIGTGIGAAITLVGMIFLVLMVYAGYLWMTARGEQEQVDKAQKIITTALIGFFIVASAYAITKFVGGKLGGGSSGSDESGEETEGEGSGLAAKACCVICSNSGNLSPFGGEAVYELATQKGCENKNDEKGKVYAEWYDDVNAANCNGSGLELNVTASCGEACKNFSINGGVCNYEEL